MPLYKTVKGCVPGEGSGSLGLVIVGRNPGQQENVLGRPFVGPGGQALNGALVRAGLVRADLYITNLVKAYTSADRPPSPEEIEACSPWLLAEIWELKPKLIIALGSQSFQSLAGEPTSVTRNRKRIHERAGFRVLGIVHPGSAVRQQAYMTMMLEDFTWAAAYLQKLR